MDDFKKLIGVTENLAQAATSLILIARDASERAAKAENLSNILATEKDGIIAHLMKTLEETEFKFREQSIALEEELLRKQTEYAATISKYQKILCNSEGEIIALQQKVKELEGYLEPATPKPEQAEAAESTPAERTKRKYIRKDNTLQPENFCQVCNKPISANRKVCSNKCRAAHARKAARARKEAEAIPQEPGK